MLKKAFQILSNLNKYERLILLGAVIIFFASSIFFGWRFYVSKTVIVPTVGGTYTEGIIGQPALINPVNATTDTDQELLPLFFSSLLQLTDSYQTSPDNKVWTLTLKKDLLWSDGQKLTADDVVYTINTIQDPNTHSPLYNDWQNILAERLNENEIRLTLKIPYAFFTDNLKQLRPIPKHIFSDIPITNFRLSNYNLEPVGSGPYKYASFAKEKNGFITEYKLESNAKFYGEKVYIENFIIKFFNNTDDLISAFNKNEIMATGGLDGQNFKNIKRDAQTFQINMPRYYALFFNLSDPSPLLKDKKFRQALSLAIDKKKIADVALQKTAMIIDGPIFPGLEGYDKEFYKEGTFDLEKAKKILTDNKFLAKKVILDLVVPQIPFLTDTSVIIKENWEQLDVKVNLIVVDPTDVANQYIKTRNYSIILFGNILKANPDTSSFWHSSQRFYPGLNLSLYNNKNIDSILEAINQQADPSLRQKNLLALQRQITEDTPAIFLFSPNYIYITSQKLNGFKVDFLASAADRFGEVNRWYLKTKRKFKRS